MIDIDINIDIHVNGVPQRVPAGSTLHQLVEMLELGPQAVALALNGAVVPRPRWSQQKLLAHDQIDIVRAIGGG